MLFPSEPSPTEPFKTPISDPLWAPPSISAGTSAGTYSCSSFGQKYAAETLPDPPKQAPLEDFKEYKDDILKHMRQQELLLVPLPNYMEHQPELDWGMRFAVLNDLVETHHCFQLSPETLFLAVNYIDRFLSVHVIQAFDMPLVGVVALFIAAKMEHTLYPAPSQLARRAAVQGISEQRIIQGEKLMLHRLGFDLGFPGPGAYYTWARGGEPVDRKADLLTLYFLEVAIMDEVFISCASSYLAAAALNLSRLISGKGDWTESLAHTYGYQAAELDCPSFLIWLACRDALVRHPAVYEKYKSGTLDAVSLQVQEIVQMEKNGDACMDTLPTKALEIRFFQPDFTASYFNVGGNRF